jgi:hypothetical protein
MKMYLKIICINIIILCLYNFPTERPPLVGEVSVKFLRIEGVAWSAQRIPPVVNSVFFTGAATFSFK